MRPAVRRGSLPASVAAILLVISGTDAHPQRPAMDSPTFMAEGAFFAIVVTDLDASVGWYESNLGLHFVKRGKSPRVPAETVVLGGHNLFVELIHHDGNALTRIDNEASVPRLLKAGVIVAPKDFDRIAGYLQKRGVDAGIFEDKEMGVRSFLDGRLWSLASDGSQRVPFTDVVNVGVLAPCGRYVVLTSNQATTTELLRVDNDGQNPTTLASGQLASWSVACSQDGQYVFYVDLHRPHTIFRVPVAGGKPMKIGEVLGELMVGRLSISPDQSFLAYPYEEYTPAPVLKLAIIPANGGPPLKIITAPGGAQLARLSPDGKSLQYVLTENGASNLWEQSLLGGKRRQLTNFPNGQIFDFHWSLDGKRLLLSRGEVNSDVVLLSNLR